MPDSVKPLSEDVPAPGERPGIGDPAPPDRDAADGGRPQADRSTAERTHLYITCRGDRYYVGQVILRASDR